MCAAAKMNKTQQLKERWEEGELDCGSITPEFIKGLSPRELGMLGELIAIDYFNERLYVAEQGYRCSEGEANLVLLDELDDVVVMAEVKTRRVALDCDTRGVSRGSGERPKAASLSSYSELLPHGRCPGSRRSASMPWASPFAAGISPIEHQYNAFDWQVS